MVLVIVVVVVVVGLFQDVLENDNINLDWMFKISLLTDLINVSF